MSDAIYRKHKRCKMIDITCKTLTGILLDYCKLISNFVNKWQYTKNIRLSIIFLSRCTSQYYKLEIKYNPLSAGFRYILFLFSTNIIKNSIFIHIKFLFFIVKIIHKSKKKYNQMIYYKVEKCILNVLLNS